MGSECADSHVGSRTPTDSMIRRYLRGLQTLGRSLHRAAALGLLAVAFCHGPSAQPIKFFGQDDPDTIGQLPPSGQAVTARNSFIANLNASTIGTEGFEGFATTACSGGSTSSCVSNPGAANASFRIRFNATNSAPDITVSGTGNRARVLVENNAQRDAFATTGTKFLKINADPDVANGNRLTLAFADGAGAPFGISAFGFYVTDIEDTDAVVLTLRPVGNGTSAANDVDLEFTGLQTAGVGRRPGDGGVIFVGFVDKRTLYERVVLTFAGTPREAYGFDDFTIGAVSQVTSEQATVTSARVADEPGWRLLSAPVRNVTINALALQNLVQGVPGTAAVQEQYPDGAPNIYVSYNGGGRDDYVAPATTATTLRPGEGFWWYWYDRAINPDDDSFGGGTSESVVLDDFYLTALGPKVTADVVRTFADNTNNATGDPTNPNPTGPRGRPLPADDDFYMVGNPFSEPFSLDAITVTGGTLQDCFLAWNPGNLAGQDPADPDAAQDGPGSYEVLFQSPVGGGPADVVAVWQGLMAEVAETTAGGQVQFTLAASGRTTGGRPFYGRRAPERYAHLVLEGETASGARTRDQAAYVRLRPDATDGWDRFDLSKATPPTASYAVIAPVGTRDGEPHGQAVLSLPDAAATVALAFEANEAGTFSLSGTGPLVDGREAVLVDLEAGAEHDLADGPYVFTAEATYSTPRFELRVQGRPVATDGGTAATFVGAPYPNPTTGGARLEVVPAEGGALTATVVDALGREVARVEVGTVVGGSPHVLDLPVAALAPGVYVVRVTGGGLEAARTITVSR